MTSRRDFLKKGGMALAGLMMAPKVLLGNKETANSVLKDNKYISFDKKRNIQYFTYNNADSTNTNSSREYLESNDIY